MKSTQTSDYDVNVRWFLSLYHTWSYISRPKVWMKNTTRAPKYGDQIRLVILLGPSEQRLYTNALSLHRNKLMDLLFIYRFSNPVSVVIVPMICLMRMATIDLLLVIILSKLWRVVKFYFLWKFINEKTFNDWNSNENFLYKRNIVFHYTYIKI